MQPKLLRAIQHNEFEAPWLVPYHKSRCADNRNNNRNLEEKSARAGSGRTFTIGSILSYNCPSICGSGQKTYRCWSSLYPTVFQKTGETDGSHQKEALKGLKDYLAREHPGAGE